MMNETVFSPYTDLYVQYMELSEKNNMSVQHYHDAYKSICICRKSVICYTMISATFREYLTNVRHTLERTGRWEGKAGALPDLYMMI